MQCKYTPTWELQLHLSGVGEKREVDGHTGDVYVYERANGTTCGGKLTFVRVMLYMKATAVHTPELFGR